MSITVQEALTRTIEHREIFHDEMLDLMRQIMSGQISPVMIAAIIVGLRVKKETIGEITAAAQVMRELATRVTVKDPENLVDIVGTGGDGATPSISRPRPCSFARRRGGASPSTATAPCLRSRAARTCWKRWAQAST